MPPLGVGREGYLIEEPPELVLGNVQSGERVVLLARRDPLGLAVNLHLLGAHQARVIILVAGERQAVALDRVGDEACRGVGVDPVERLENRLHVVPAQVGHQVVQGRVVVLVEQRGDPCGRAQIALQPNPPAGAAAEDQCRVERVGAVVDPVPQGLAAGSLEDGLEAAAVLQRDDVPVHRPEDAVDALKQPILDHAVQALAVVIDDPPDIADVVLPALQQGFEDVALVELGIARQARSSGPAGWSSGTSRLSRR